MATNSAFNINIDKIKFENIDFDEWKKLIQYVLNYEIQLSNIENYDRLLTQKAYLEAFLKCGGNIPGDVRNKYNELTLKKQELKELKLKLEIAEFSNTRDIKELEEKIESLNKEVNKELYSYGKKVYDDKVWLYFNNPYFLEGNDQKFSRRDKALNSELKEIKWIIKKQLKPAYKPSLKLMDVIAYDIRRILCIKDKNKDVKPLILFVRPYIQNIINDKNYYYQELLAIAL